jgi:2-phosphosulfolactate phosphatase
MQVHRAILDDCPTLQGAVVVIDVLRSFTTAAVALAQGAVAVLPVASVADALAWRARDPRALLVGAVGGGAPVPGLDLGNTPSQLQGLDLCGRRLVLYSAGGTQGLLACRRAGPLLAGSLWCAQATAHWLRQQGLPSVTLVVTGTWTDRDGDEDHACADLIAALLQGDDPPREPYVQRVRASDFGRRFGSHAHAHLPAADLDCCARADVIDFAMAVRPGADGPTIERARVSAPRCTIAAP